MVILKSFKCFITNCPNDPEYICKCTPNHTIFCSYHSGVHMKKKKHHEWVDLYFEPHPESRLLVIEKVNEIKKEIRLCLDKLLWQYRELLKTFESSLSIAMEKYYKLDAECNDIILFASQDKILNISTENKIEEPLKAKPKECKEIIKYWARLELKTEIDKIKKCIEKTYENIELNPFLVDNASTIISGQIHFIKNNNADFNTLNLSKMQTSKINLELPKKYKNCQFNGTGLSNVLLADQDLVFFNGTVTYSDENWSYNTSEAWTFIVNKDKTVKFLESGTKSNNPALTFYKGCVYALGGGTQKSVAEKYDLKKKLWERLAFLPRACFCCSHSALFEDKILITAYCLTELISYDIKKNSYKKIESLYLNNSLNKSVLTYDKRVYVIEFDASIYQSEIGDTSRWEFIGDSQLSNCMVQSYSVAFNGCIYFISTNNQLVEFNLKTKIPKYVDFFWRC